MFSVKCALKSYCPPQARLLKHSFYKPPFTNLTHNYHHSDKTNKVGWRMMDTNKHGMVGNVNKTLHMKRSASSHQHNKNSRGKAEAGWSVWVHISVSKQPPDLVFIHCNYQWQLTTQHITDLKIKTTQPQEPSLSFWVSIYTAFRSWNCHFENMLPYM